VSKLFDAKPPEDVKKRITAIPIIPTIKEKSINPTLKIIVNPKLIPSNIRKVTEKVITFFMICLPSTMFTINGLKSFTFLTIKKN
jgi:hypothetical protein